MIDGIFATAVRAVHMLADAVEMTVIETADAVIATGAEITSSAAQAWRDGQYPRDMSYPQVLHAEVLTLPYAPEVIYVTSAIAEKVAQIVSDRKR